MFRKWNRSRLEYDFISHRLQREYRNDLLDKLLGRQPGIDSTTTPNHAVGCFPAISYTSEPPPAIFFSPYTLLVTSGVKRIVRHVSLPPSSVHIAEIL